MSALDETIDKISQGIRISEEEARHLLNSGDLVNLGCLAQEKEDRFGDCLLPYSKSCFLGFSESFYLRSSLFKNLSFPSLLESLKDLSEKGFTELVVDENFYQGKSFEGSLEFISMLRSADPKLKIKAFTPYQIQSLSKSEGLSYGEICRSLKEVGVRSLRGFDAHLFQKKSFHKEREDLKKIYCEAHEASLKFHGTLFYGPKENLWDYIQALSFYRDLQDQLGNCEVFSPYSLLHRGGLTSGSHDLRIMAITRLYLDNVRTIQANWLVYGPDIASLSLSFGANHLGPALLVDPFAHEKTVLSKSHLRVLLERTSKIRYRKCDILSEDSIEKCVRFAEESSLCGLLQDPIFKKTPEENQNRRSFSYSYEVNLETSATLLDRIEREKLSFPLGEIIIKVDLSSYEKKEDDLLSNWERLKALLERAQNFLGSTEILLSGFQFLWQVAQTKKLSLNEIFSRLEALGVKSIESSSKEFEGGLTNSEIISFHKEAHRAGLVTTPKLELSLQIDGKTILWKPFFQRLNSYLALQRETSGIRAFLVEPAIDASMGMSDFLYGIAVTKYFLKKKTQSPKLVVSLEHLPLFGIQEELPEGLKLRDPGRRKEKLQNKFLPLLCHVGVEDFGLFSYRAYCHRKETFSFREGSSSCDAELFQRDILFKPRAFNTFDASLAH